MGTGIIVPAMGCYDCRFHAACSDGSAPAKPQLNRSASKGESLRTIAPERASLGVDYRYKASRIIEKELTLWSAKTLSITEASLTHRPRFSEGRLKLRELDDRI